MSSAAASAYWSMRYSSVEGIVHHRRQNQEIAHDLLAAIRYTAIHPYLRQARSIVEVGCGTGELAALMQSRFKTPRLLATDASLEAVHYAETRHPQVTFGDFDVLVETMVWPRFDVSVASNVLEHFKEPSVVVERMLSFSDWALIVVPYRQVSRDGYDAEGGAGHASSFTVAWFRQFRLIESVIFESKGWQHKAGGDSKPRQLAVLVGKP